MDIFFVAVSSGRSGSEEDITPPKARTCPVIFLGSLSDVLSDVNVRCNL